MANLLGQNIGTNYKGILNLDTINTPLDATLRAVTDGEGNASPLELSTDAVSVGAISGARLAIKGSGTTSATTALLVQNSAGTELMSIDNDGIVRVNSIKGINYPNNNLSLGTNAEFLGFLSITAPKIGVNIAVPSGVQAAIKGSGTTSATIALLVQNSAGSNLLSVKDDGLFTLGANKFVVSADGFTTLQYLDCKNHAYFRLQVSVGSGSLTASAQLSVDSTTRGFLPPRMTTTQKNAIATPASGLIVYDETTNKLACYNGTTWNDLF